MVICVLVERLANSNISATHIPQLIVEIYYSKKFTICIVNQDEIAFAFCTCSGYTYSKTINKFDACTRGPAGFRGSPKAK